MVSAVILLVVEKSRINEVAEQLVELGSITEVYSVAGQYDLVAIARVADNEAIATAVTNQMLTAARAVGFEKKDFAVLFDVLAKMSGAAE